MADDGAKEDYTVSVDTEILCQHWDAGRSAEKPKRDAEHNTRPLYHFTVPGGGRGGDHSGAQTG